MNVGFTCGVFDLFHAGHVLMLEECKQHCDFLIVALNRAENLPKGKNIPVFSIDDRVKIVEACSYVDKVFTYNSETELEELLKEISPTTRFLGEDYKDKPITGKEYSKITYFTNRGHGKSTSDFIRQIVDRYSK